LTGFEITMPSSRHHAEWLSLIEVSGPFLSVPVLERVFPQGLDAHDPDHVRVLRLAFDEWEEDRESESPRPAIHREWIRFLLKETLGLPDEVLAEGQAIPSTIRATISEHGETLRPDLVVCNPSERGGWRVEGAGKDEQVEGAGQKVEGAAKDEEAEGAGQRLEGEKRANQSPLSSSSTRHPSPIARHPSPVAHHPYRLLVQVYPATQNLEKPIPGRHWKASPATRMMELLHATDVRLGLITNGEH